MAARVKVETQEKLSQKYGEKGRLRQFTSEDIELDEAEDDLELKREIMINRSMQLDDLVNTLEKEFKSCTRELIKKIVRYHLDIFRVDEI